MPNITIRIAKPVTGLTSQRPYLRKDDRFVSAIYHHLRPGKQLDCSRPGIMVGQKGKEATVGFFHSRGIQSIQFSREAALSKDQFIKLLAIMYAATEMPQALLSDKWVPTNGIEVQMQRPAALFEKWEKVTLGNLAEFTAGNPKKLTNQPKKKQIKFQDKKITSWGSSIAILATITTIVMATSPTIPLWTALIPFGLAIGLEILIYKLK